MLFDDDPYPGRDRPSIALYSIISTLMGLLIWAILTGGGNQELMAKTPMYADIALVLVITFLVNAMIVSEWMGHSCSLARVYEGGIMRVEEGKRLFKWKEFDTVGLHAIPLKNNGIQTIEIRLTKGGDIIVAFLTNIYKDRIEAIRSLILQASTSHVKVLITESP